MCGFCMRMLHRKESEMPVRNWVEVVDEPFPRVDRVTVQMQEAVFKQARVLRGSVRLMLGRLPTSEEIEDRRLQALGNPLS